MTQGPTSLAHVFLLCPNRRIVAKIQTGSGYDESAVHLMRPQGLGVWYIGSHHRVLPSSVLITFVFTSFLLVQGFLWVRWCDSAFFLEPVLQTLAQLSFHK